MKHVIGLITALLVAFLASLDAAEPSAKPNIIIILADDLGYGDVSCYGAKKIKTPNIDRLAREGMKFTTRTRRRPFAHPRAMDCSRAATAGARDSTEAHWARHPLLIEKGPNDTRLAAQRQRLQNRSHRQVASRLRHAKLVDWNQPLAPGPLEVGFDYHFGVPQNHNDNSRAFVENHQVVGRKAGEEFRIVPDQAFPEGLACRRNTGSPRPTQTAREDPGHLQQ